MKFPISRFTIAGNSMLPTFHPGQDVLTFNWAYFGKAPKVGDIVVIKVDNKELIKRVKSVQNGEVVVEGDNRQESTDSRHFGAIKMDQILGQVIYQASPDLVDCPRCSSAVIGIYGRKDAICQNCGFKLTCCGEP